MCRSDRTPYPCRLHRWGRRVLHSRGLSERAVDELAAQAEQQLRVPEGRR
ncbi:hypothetical protein ABZ807_14375 [Micromonospora sp. NPDC047548]